MEELAFRQVHLDFHTSGEIPGVGEAFDPDAFVATLQAAGVNSITCFAKCHHGLSYYPTEVGVREACRRRLTGAGADLADDRALQAQSLAIARDFMRRMTSLVHHIRPEASVFYNSRLRLDFDPQRGVRHELPYYTHVEIESL